MKRYTDYTEEELLNLTGEQVQNLVNIEIAEEGIIPLLPVESKPIPEIDIKPTITAYEIHGLIFLNKEDAVKVAELKPMVEGYDYSVDSSYKYLESREGKYGDDTGVRPRSYYDRNDVERVKSAIKQRNKIKSENESNAVSYAKYLKQTEDCRDRVHSAINEAARNKAELDRALSVYADYLKLAEGSEEIAKNFFRKAYKGNEEMLKAVINE